MFVLSNSSLLGTLKTKVIFFVTLYIILIITQHHLIVYNKLSKTFFEILKMNKNFIVK